MIGSEPELAPMASSEIQPMPPLEIWLDSETLASVSTSEFWNDVELERTKQFWSADKLHMHLNVDTSLLAQLEAVMRLATDLGRPISGNGLELGAGACWVSAVVSRKPDVREIYAVDFSRHRLEMLAPQVCSWLEGEEGKVRRALGSFYDVRMPDSVVDFVLLSQSFHHATDPQRLLQEIARVLKPGAPLLICGETPIYPMTLAAGRLKNALKFVVPRSFYGGAPIRKIWPSVADLYPGDEESGDLQYLFSEYISLLSSGGFAPHVRRERGYTVFVGLNQKTHAG